VSPRMLSRQELAEIGLDESQIETVISRQSQKPVRRYKYVAFLTPEEAKSASEISKQDFVRATEYKSKVKIDNA